MHYISRRRVWSYCLHTLIILILLLPSIAYGQKISGGSVRGSYLGQYVYSGGGGGGVACTDGVDCLCDTLGATVASGATVAHCQDWEDPDWRDPNGADAAWRGTYRGESGLWADLYLGSTLNSSWAGTIGSTNDPAVPTYGSSCTSIQICGLSLWIETDTEEDPFQCPTRNRNGWSTPTGVHYCAVGIISEDPPNQVDHMTAGKVLGITESPAGDNSQFMFSMIPEASSDHVASIEDRAAQGISGRVSFGGNRDEIGITWAEVYAENIYDSNILRSYWKHHELYASGQSANGEYWFGGNHTGAFAPLGADLGVFPFSGFKFLTGMANCESGPLQLTAVVGRYKCRYPDGSGPFSGSYALAATIGTGANQYTQSVHWPLGTRGCLRIWQKRQADNTLDWWVKLTTANTGGELTVMHFENLPVANTPHNGYIAEQNWNRYSNANYDQGASTDVSETTGSAHDNMVWVYGGEPATCAEINFTP